MLKHAAVPLTQRHLALLKWKDAEEHEHSFHLVKRVSAKWMVFGTLLGIDSNLLKGWNTQHQADFNKCWNEVMHSWLEGGAGGSCHYPITWEGLCTLLKDAELPEVVKELREALVGSSNQ